LVSAAVRAAILAKAPRRTVSAVAAAVVSAFVGATAKAATQPQVARQPAGTQKAAESGDAGDAATLLAALRSARASQRRRKKERRRAAKEVATAQAHEEEAGMPAGDAPGGGGQTPACAAAEALEVELTRPTPSAPDGIAEPPDKKQRAEEGSIRSSRTVVSFEADAREDEAGSLGGLTVFTPSPPASVTAAAVTTTAAHDPGHRLSPGPARSRRHRAKGKSGR